jgi:hypothetical protein
VRPLVCYWIDNRPDGRPYPKATIRRLPPFVLQSATWARPDYPVIQRANQAKLREMVREAFPSLNPPKVDLRGVDLMITLGGSRQFKDVEAVKRYLNLVALHHQRHHEGVLGWGAAITAPSTFRRARMHHEDVQEAFESQKRLKALEARLRARAERLRTQGPCTVSHPLHRGQSYEVSAHRGDEVLDRLFDVSPGTAALAGEVLDHTTTKEPNAT